MAIAEIDVDELANRLEQGAALIDVRQPDEFEEARVPEAVLIPLGELPDRVGELPTDTQLLIICRSGARSMRACELLGQSGLEATNVAGGTLAWIDSGREVATGVPGG
jgi:rhodanese-related sulfurtransferase